MKISWSLTNRIFFATALMAVLSIGLAIYVVNVAVTRQAEDELRRGLEDAATLVEHNRDLLVEQFAREARLIADLPKLKAAVGVDHAPTVRPIAEDYQQQIGSDVFVVTNADGTVLAQIGDVDLAPDRVSQLPTVQAALTGRATASFWPRAGGDVQVVTIPIWIDQTQPELLGTLSVGFSLDQNLAERFKQLTASEIAFLVGDTVQASTLPAEHAATIADATAKADGDTLWIGDEEYVAVTRTLSMAGGSFALPAAGDNLAQAPVAVILRSRTEQIEFLRSLQTALAATALLAVLVAVLVRLRGRADGDPPGRRHHCNDARDVRHRRPHEEDHVARPGSVERRGHTASGQNVQHHDRLDRAFPTPGRAAGPAVLPRTTVHHRRS